MFTTIVNGGAKQLIVLYEFIRQLDNRFNGIMSSFLVPSKKASDVSISCASGRGHGLEDVKKVKDK